MSDKVALEFARRVRGEDLSQDLRVTYRAVGGPPGKHADISVTIDPTSGARVTVVDETVSRDRRDASIPPEDVDPATLFDQIVEGLHSLPGRGDVEFLPDSLIGVLTISVETEGRSTFYFQPEADKRNGPDLVAPSIDRALSFLWDLSHRVLDEPERWRSAT